MTTALKLPKQALNFMVLGVAARHMATDPNFLSHPERV